MYKPWRLSDLKAVPSNGLKVFSCFHCGGGSTMGYKLAGYDVIGGVEIDPKMMAVYRANHNPKHSYLMGVQEFKNLAVLPEALYNLDILDGSPPCSSFSKSGSREKKWGKESKFREGQAHQVLDDLFFDFIDIAKKLRPKVVIAENVKGLIQGNARGYVKQIFADLSKAGYKTQLFLLNAAAMGVPQKRERTFFVSRRADLNWSDLKLSFDEKQITVSEALAGINDLNVDSELLKTKFLTGHDEMVWRWCIKNRKPFFYNYYAAVENNPVKRFNWIISFSDQPSYTVASSMPPMTDMAPRFFNPLELMLLQSFPIDYSFLTTKPEYLIGMSVPPFMTNRLASQIHKQWFSS